MLRNSKKGYEKIIIAPADSEEERMGPPSQHLVLEDRRIINRTVDVILRMLYDYFKTKYNITEQSTYIFNLWPEVEQVYWKRTPRLNKTSIHIN